MWTLQPPMMKTCSLPQNAVRATHPAFACARSTFYLSDQIIRMPIQPTNLFGRNLTLFWLYVPRIYSEATCEDQYIISLNLHIIVVVVDHKITIQKWWCLHHADY